jgi:hypothetical protein
MKTVGDDVRSLWFCSCRMIFKTPHVVSCN